MFQNLLSEGLSLLGDALTTLSGATLGLFRRAFIASLLWGAVSGIASHANAQENAVLILDHSGSMWAKAEGKAKITHQRNAVKAMLDEFQGALQLGVLAFGTQKKNACDSFETLKPIEEIDPPSDGKKIDATAPKGSAPVAASLAEAEKLFTGQPGAHSIILVTDSTDDCEADPCAAALKLKQSQPNAVVHLIAYDVKGSNELEPLSCVPEQTGGMFAVAENAAELTSELRKAFELAANGTSLGGQSISDPFSGGAIQGAPTSNEPGTLALSAKLSAESPVLTSGLAWRIYDSKIKRDGSYNLLHKFDEASPSVTLLPGDYLINVAYGLANVTKRVTVWPQKQLEDSFVLNAGGLRLYATLANQPLFSEPSLKFDVYSDETDQFGNRRRVIAGAKSGVVMRLNGGTYRVESSYGDSNARMEVDVTIEPGKVTEATIDHQAGKVTFKLVDKPGGEALADTIWYIYLGNELVKKSGGAFPSHVLRAGDYRVRVEHAEKEYAASFAVAVGDKKQVEVVIP